MAWQHEGVFERKMFVHSELKLFAASDKYTPFQSGTRVCLFRACAESFGFPFALCNWYW